MNVQIRNGVSEPFLMFRFETMCLKMGRMTPATPANCGFQNRIGVTVNSDGRRSFGTRGHVTNILYFENLNAVTVSASG